MSNELFGEGCPLEGTLRGRVPSNRCRRGIVFEVSFAPALRGAIARRNLVSNGLLLARATNGRGLLLTSAAFSAVDQRGPYEATAIGAALGLSAEQARLASLDAASLQCPTVPTFLCRPTPP